MSKHDDFQELIETLDMESWLDREGVKYRVTRGSRGTQLNVKECPCCGNSSYKVYLNADNGLGNCFSGDCEKKFNKWSFVRSYLGHLPNRDVIEHIKEVAREQGWRPSRKRAVVTNLETELIIPESLALPIDGRNLKYLENRNITAEVASYFGLRYSHIGEFRYLDEDGKKQIQNYSKRVIVPIFDLAGDLVSFQGRDITNKADKKYLFPPGFASTGAHLYNGQNAVGASRIVIGEGAFDVMAIKIALDEEMALRDIVPVGSFGKHLSMGGENSQMEKLMALRERGLKQVTFMWDGEARAINDAVDAALEVRKMGLVARVAILPKDKDPNEVPTGVVRSAFYKAEVMSAQVATKLKLMFGNKS
jgi:DNA primase